MTDCRHCGAALMPLMASLMMLLFAATAAYAFLSA